MHVLVLVLGLSLSGLDGGVTVLFAGRVPSVPGSCLMASGLSLASKSNESQLVLSGAALTLHFLPSSSSVTSGSDFRFFKFTFRLRIAGRRFVRSVSELVSAFLRR